MRARGLRWAVASVCVAASARAEPTTQEFTYQGRLTQNGQAVEGEADVRFTLWDAAGGGAQVGPMLAVNGTLVSGGLVRVMLDFGAGTFSGEGRWLEVQARVPAGVGVWELLTPRQAVTPTPYALHALNPGPVGPVGPVGPAGPPGTTQWSGLLGIPAGFVDGVDDVGPAYTAGAGVRIEGGEVSIAPGGVQGPMIAEGAVGGSKLADGSVTAAKIANRSRTVFVPSGSMTFEFGAGGGGGGGGGGAAGEVGLMQGSAADATGVWARSLGDADESATFTVQVPADYAGSGAAGLGAPRLTVYWSSDDAGGVCLDVAWRRMSEMMGGDAGNVVRYSLRSGAGVVRGDSTGESAVCVPLKRAMEQAVPSEAEGDVWAGAGAVWSAGDVVVVTLRRNGASAWDPNAGRVYLLGVGFTYEAEQ